MPTRTPAPGLARAGPARLSRTLYADHVPTPTSEELSSGRTLEAGQHAGPVTKR